MKHTISLSVLAALATLPAAQSSADIHNYLFGYNIDYNQTSPTDVVPDVCASVYTLYGDDGDFTSAWTIPSASGVSYTMNYSQPGYYVGATLYPDTASMFTDFPLGDYTLYCDGGTLGPLSGSLTAPDPLNLPDAVPQFDPAQFPEYQTIDATNDYTFRFNTFDATGTDSVVYLTVNAYPSSTRVYFVQANPQDGMALIPAGALKLNRRFTVSLYFVSDIEIDNAGFNGAVSVIENQVVTTTLIKTGDCPPDFNGDGFLDFFDFNDFVTAFEDGDPDADYNGDGFVDFFDFNDFVYGFEAGC